MVILVTGQPGNGKTLTAFYAIVRLLQMDDKAEVVTNIKIFDGLLEGYLRSKGCKNGLERIKKLELEETTEFYRSSIKKREWKEDSLGNVVPLVIPNPVTYVIDEAHLFWGARNFQKTSTAVLSYVSQHRHLGDNIILITQHPEQIDKAFRRLVDEYWLMTNLEKRRVMGFKGPTGMFKKSVYFHTPSILQRPAENERFKIDLEIATCYDTSAGKRFGDNLADTKQKKKGLPFTAAVMAVSLAVVGIVWFLSKVPQWSQKAVGKIFVAADDVGKETAEKLVNDGAGMVGLAPADETGPQVETNMGWVSVPYSRKGMRTVDGKSVLFHDIGDEKVWTNLPPQTTTQTVEHASQPAYNLAGGHQVGPIANPAATVGPYRWVRLRMWDGTSRLIRIKNYGTDSIEQPDNGGGDYDGTVDQERTATVDDGL